MAPGVPSVTTNSTATQPLLSAPGWDTRGTIVWLCLPLYTRRMVVFIFVKRGTVGWMCIPLYKMYSCISVHTFVQKGTVVWLCIPLYEKYSCMDAYNFV